MIYNNHEKTKNKIKKESFFLKSIKSLKNIFKKSNKK